VGAGRSGAKGGLQVDGFYGVERRGVAAGVGQGTYSAETARQNGFAHMMCASDPTSRMYRQSLRIFSCSPPTLFRVSLVQVFYFAGLRGPVG